jgi:hypothetical protein
MKIVYIAHPISGNVAANLERIRLIARQIMLEDPKIVAFAPYWFDCHVLNDDVPAERQRGIANDIELFKRRFIDEVWLCGPRISAGMLAEKNLAEQLGIPVIDKTNVLV